MSGLLVSHILLNLIFKNLSCSLLFKVTGHHLWHSVRQVTSSCDTLLADNNCVTPILEYRFRLHRFWTPVDWVLIEWNSNLGYESILKAQSHNFSIDSQFRTHSLLSYRCWCLVSRRKPVLQTSVQNLQFIYPIPTIATNCFEFVQ